MHKILFYVIVPNKYDASDHRIVQALGYYGIESKCVIISIKIDINLAAENDSI